MRKVCGAVLAVVLSFGMLPTAHADETMVSSTEPSDVPEPATSGQASGLDGSILSDSEAVTSKGGNALVALSRLNEGSDYESGRLIVTFNREVTADAAKSDLTALGMTDLDTLFWPSEEESSRYFGVMSAVCPAGKTTEETIHSLSGAMSVKCVELNRIVETQGFGSDVRDSASSVDPNADAIVKDPERNDQWYLDAVGVPEAWDTARCEGTVSVAVLDTGIDLGHPDLVNNIDIDHAWDVVGDRSLDGDNETHGTSVAGIISAQTNNWLGTAGISYNAKIVPINIAYEKEVDGETSYFSEYRFMERAITRLVDDPTIHNLRVINISFSGDGDTPSFSLQQAVDRAYEKGIIVVASAGNDVQKKAHKGNYYTSFPSDLDHVVSVISTNKLNSKSGYSNYGPAKDISAPGEQIYTSRNRSYVGDGKQGSTWAFGGTSAAAPVVSGTLALMFAANPDLTAEQAERVLKSTARDVGPAGFDSYYGWGIVDAKKAVESFVDFGKKSIVGAKISGLENIEYTSDLDSLPIKVTLGGKVLRKGIDYDVSYLNAGPNFMAEAVVRGRGAYRGIISASFFVAGKWERLSGPIALDTMESIVSRGFTNNRYDSVIVVTVNGYWDALSASGLAGLEGCPVLLTESDHLSEQTARTIRRMGARCVHVVGGTAAVASTVDKQLMNIPSVVKVDRIAGDDATETAVEIYKAGKRSGGWGKTAVLATSNTFHDALSGSPFSYAKHSPIFLTNGQKRLNPSSVEAIKSGGFDRIVVLGGTAAISDDVKAQLPGVRLIRLSGDDAMKTSVKVADFCVSEGMSADEMAVASGSTYYDAVAGAALCGSKSSVLLLVLDGDKTAMTDFVSPRRSEIKHGYILGGTAAVSDNLRLALEQAAVGKS